MNLSLKISLLASVIGIFFMMLVFLNTQNTLNTQSKQHIITDYKNDITKLENTIKLILEKYTEVVNLSSLLRKDAVKNPELLKKRFNNSMKNIPLIKKMILISPDGKEKVISSRERLFAAVDTGKSYKNENIFKEALKGKTYYSNVYFTKDENEMAIDISKRIIDIRTNEIIGLLIVQISLGEIQEQISNTLVNGNGISIINLSNNKFIYKSSEAEKINEKKLLSLKGKSVKIIEESGTEYFLISSDFKFDRLHWKIIISNSTDNIFSHIKKTFNINLVFLIIAILLLALIMFLFIKYSLKPLRILTREIDALSNKLNANKRSADEFKDSNEITNIKQHFHTFSKLIEKEREKLEEYNKSLETKISQEIEMNKKHEEKIAQNAKLVSMGEMIGNIAHQWRQPLSIISTSISGMEMKSDINDLSKEEIKNFSNIIIKQVDYLSKTIDDFRRFIKGDDNFLKISIKDTLKETLSLVNAALKNNYIKLIENTDDDMEIPGNKSELTQALINIINNAKDSMADIKNERLLFISTKLIDKESLELKILDNGGGIDPKIISRIFEPYFSTKHQSLGTGIGLSMVDQIIRERHKGVIFVSNEEYEYEGTSCKGACFRIVFKK